MVLQSWTQLSNSTTNNNILSHTTWLSQSAFPNHTILNANLGLMSPERKYSARSGTTSLFYSVWLLFLGKSEFSTNSCWINILMNKVIDLYLLYLAIFICILILPQIHWMPNIYWACVGHFFKNSYNSMKYAMFIY